MNEIQMADGFFRSEVDEKHLDEIKEDLQNQTNELIGYQLKDKGKIEVIIDISEMNPTLNYIH